MLNVCTNNNPVGWDHVSPSLATDSLPPPSCHPAQASLVHCCHKDYGSPLTPIDSDCQNQWESMGNRNAYDSSVPWKLVPDDMTAGSLPVQREYFRGPNVDKTL